MSLPLQLEYLTAGSLHFGPAADTRGYTVSQSCELYRGQKLGGGDKHMCACVHACVQCFAGDTKQQWRGC